MCYMPLDLPRPSSTVNSGLQGQTMLYFAYGSNMCPGRLRGRVPSATAVGVARLPRHVFRFHKCSTDGSGKGNAFLTGNTADVVWGVIFDIDLREKGALDDAEGLGYGYLEKTATVFDGSNKPLQDTLYYATDIDNKLSPYTWYKRFVVEGAQQHGLPTNYIAEIDAMPAIEDKNRERDARNRVIGCD